MPWWTRQPAGDRKRHAASLSWDDRLRASGVVQCDDLDDLLPYRAPAQYEHQPHIIRFGAFLSWPGQFRNPTLLAVIADQLERVSEQQRRALGLVDFEHQASGHACSQHAFIARPVRLRPELLPFATELCAHFYHAGGGWFEEGEGQGLIAQFETMIRAAGLAPYDHSSLQRETPVESIYPIAATSGNLAKLVADHDAVLRELAPLLAHHTLRHELLILLLAENSD